MSSRAKFHAPAQAEAHSESETPQLPGLSAPVPPDHQQHRRKKATPGVIEQKSLWNTAIIRQAIVDSFRKLNPRSMGKNPVMFVVEVGSVLTSLLLIDNLMHQKPGFGFNLQITLWLWFTVLFANFAEAMAEGRGKAQADTLRKAKGETMAVRVQTKDGPREEVSSSALRAGDLVFVEAGHHVPGDG